MKSRHTPTPASSADSCCAGAGVDEAAADAGFDPSTAPHRYRVRWRRISWPRRILIGPFVLAIWGYQWTLSPFVGSCCRFYPTCSSYALEALERRGLFMGVLLASWRIARCNPFSRAGYDPVKY